MSVLSLAQVLRSYLLFSTVGFIFTCGEALATSCQVYPSEYAYRDDTVARAESISANCRRYPPRDGDMGIVYIHCDGEQLKLSDSDRGSNTEYIVSSYYVWTSGSAEQLLFIFPTRVSLTTITLHYYSDSVGGRPRLRFYAVPDDFDVWDIIPVGAPFVGIASVPPGVDLAGRRSVSINTSFNTKKVLIHKFSSSFSFSLSEVEFFMLCTPFTGTTEAITTALTSQLTTSNESSVTTTVPLKITNTELFEYTEDGSYRTQSSSSLQIRSNPSTREIIAWILVAILAVIHTMRIRPCFLHN